MDRKTATFHDAKTGETIVRELTQEEIEELAEIPDDLAN